MKPVMWDPPPPEQIVARGLLACTGRESAKREFYFEAYRRYATDETWYFDVWPNPRSKFDYSIIPPTRTEAPACLRLVPLGDGRLRVDFIDCSQKWAYKKGIGPAILKTAVGVTGCEVVSGLSCHATEAESQTEDARAMWCGMVSRGEAALLPSEGRFRVLV